MAAVQTAAGHVPVCADERFAAPMQTSFGCAASVGVFPAKTDCAVL
jgi:hypothetical protein